MNAYIHIFIYLRNLSFHHQTRHICMTWTTYLPLTRKLTQVWLQQQTSAHRRIRKQTTLVQRVQNARHLDLWFTESAVVMASEGQTEIL